jgi:hypothetical protein
MMSNRSMPDWNERESQFDGAGSAPGEAAHEAVLDQWFRAYAEACPDPDASVHFMPRLWAGIEAREASRNVFSRMAGALVTAALAASAILAVLVSLTNDRTYPGTFIQAITADHAAQLEPYHLDRLSEMEQQ